MSAPIVHVVDDDASVLAAMSRLLRASGFAVTTFASAVGIHWPRGTKTMRRVVCSPMCRCPA